MSGEPICKVAPTTEELANQLHAMLTSPNGIMYPNPVNDAVVKHKEKFPFIESEKVLAILESDVGATPERFLRKVLHTLKYKDTIKYLHLHRIHPADEGPPFDFSKFSEHLAEYLPKCEFFHVWDMPICNFRIESNSIKQLLIVCPQLHDEEWELNCPNLVHFDMQNHTPPVKNFQRALINSPRIETFYSHKYWHTDDLPALYLPNCTDFTFRRGEHTKSLKLYLPKVKYLALDACYSLKNVELLTQGHADHAEWNKVPGTELTKFKLSLENAIVSTRALKSLKDSGRVSNPNSLSEAHEEEEDPYALLEELMAARR